MDILRTIFISTFFFLCIIMAVSAIPPSINSVVLNATSVNNLSSDNLTAYPINVNQSNAPIQYDWYKDGALSAVFLGNATFQNTIPSSFTTAGDVWFVNATPKVLTNNYNVSNASFVDTLDISAQETFSLGMAFNNDGTKLYVVGLVSKAVHEYDLSTAFDVSTGVFVDNLSVSAQDTVPQGIAFNNDGTKLYVVGDNGNDINEYDLSPAFDVSTGTFVDTLNVSAQEASPKGMAFNNDGTKLYVVGSTSDKINEYDLSTAFDVSTGTFVDSFSVFAQDQSPQGMAFNNDGTKVYMIGSARDNISEYDLSPAFDVSTGVFVDNFSVSAQETNPQGMAFNNDGTKLYVVGTVGDDINEYDVGSVERGVGVLSNNLTILDIITISGIVFNDTDGNGVFGGSDSGIQDVTIRLWDDTNSNQVLDIGTDVVINGTTTNSTGGYSFANILSGGSILDVSDLNFVLLSFDRTTNRTIAVNSNSTANFGLISNLTLSKGAIQSTVVINDTTPNGPTLNDTEFYGTTLSNIGDLDGDGVQDIAVGAFLDDAGGSNRGAVHIHFMNTNGSVKSTVEINSLTANGPNLTDDDNYGFSVTSLGDLDGDGVQDIAVGARSDDAGGSNRGAVHIHFMNTNGSVKSTVEINANTSNGPTLNDGDNYGWSLENLGDLDDDGVQDLVVSAVSDDDGGSNRGAVHIHFMNTNGSVKSTVEINNATTNGPTLNDGDNYGYGVTNIGDLDGDGVQDLAVGAINDDAGGTNRGAVHISFLNTNGSVKSTVEINDNTPNGPVLSNNDFYGSSVTSIGDLDGDSVQDLAVGAPTAGTLYIHFLNTNGSVKSTVEINNNTPNGPDLSNDDEYGRSVAGLGDLDGDSVLDIAVGANSDDAGGTNRGAVHIHFMAEGVPPTVFNLMPTAGTNFSVLEVIEIAANVTDNVAVDTVLANITLPNGTIQQLTLNNTSGDKFNTSFTIPVLAGQYNITFIANDTSNNVNNTETTFFTILDVDNDGVPDSIDTLIGPESNVTTTGISDLNITVGGNSTNGTFSGDQEVNFFDGSTLLVNFTHNFSSSTITLSQINISMTTNGISINLNSQLLAGETKTLYITDNNFVSLCASNAEIDSPSEISSSCTGANETDLTSCLGSSTEITIGNLTCVDTGSTIQVSNFTNSGLLGTPSESATTTTTTGGGGGSEGFGCFIKWDCNDWTECSPESIQSRTCENVGTCPDIFQRPVEIQGCMYIIAEEEIEIIPPLEETTSVEKELVEEKEEALSPFTSIMLLITPNVAIVIVTMIITSIVIFILVRELKPSRRNQPKTKKTVNKSRQ